MPGFSNSPPAPQERSGIDAAAFHGRATIGPQQVCWLQVSAKHLGKLCSICGGSLANTQAAGAIMQQLRVCCKLGRYHGFELLHDTSSWLLADPVLQLMDVT